MMNRIDAELPPVKTLTEKEAREEFDAQARRRLGISGEEFLRRWDAGEYPDPDGDPDVIWMAMLLPLVR